MDAKIVARELIPQLKFKMTEDDYYSQSQEFQESVKYNGGICYAKFNLENEVEYDVPDWLRPVLESVGEVIPTLVAQEYGQFDPEANYGVAQIVCGVTGKPILPFYTTDKPNVASASFGVPHSVIICRAQKRSDQRLILRIFDAKLQYSPENETIRLVVKLFWTGNTFVTAPRRYQTALAFAIAKASIPYGAGPAYYAVRVKTPEAVQPNGD